MAIKRFYRRNPSTKSNQDLRTLTDIEVMKDTIFPNQKNGALRTGSENIPLNRSVQRLGQGRNKSQIRQLEARYMNDGGVSEMFGSSPKFP